MIHSISRKNHLTVHKEPLGAERRNWRLHWRSHVHGHVKYALWQLLMMIRSKRIFCRDAYATQATAAGFSHYRILCIQMCIAQCDTFRSSMKRSPELFSLTRCFQWASTNGLAHGRAKRGESASKCSNASRRHGAEKCRDRSETERDANCIAPVQTFFIWHTKCGARTSSFDYLPRNALWQAPIWVGINHSWNARHQT